MILAGDYSYLLSVCLGTVDGLGLYPFFYDSAFLSIEPHFYQGFTLYFHSDYIYGISAQVLTPILHTLCSLKAPQLARFY